MRRGRLRVLLGAAPGVGKTYTMLEEGRRLADEGHDVVVAFVETHGRAATAAMIAGLEVVPRRTVTHRGMALEEMDVDAVLARKPEIALVDELAHTNAPGSRHPKRWQDVEDLLAAGIDVISTVNTQHIESLGDVVLQITGVPQRETIPDAVLRSADQIEVVDLAPQALRDRLASGLVYPAERIDAALSNYFRLGNLTALRELALLWLADEVDTALKAYRAEHGIGRKWEARERVVVALTGGPEGETLLRRGARIASRSSGGELMAVHVTNPDGLQARHPGALERQRTLVEQLGGTFHQVVGEDIPRALVDFARAMDATQLVIGVSRRSRLAAALSGPGIGATVIRESGDIDVHIVTHAAAGRNVALPEARRRAQPQPAHRGLRRRAHRRAAAQLAARDVPHRVVDHERRARLPAARHRRRAHRRHLAGAVRRGAVGAHAELPLRRAAVHAHDQRSAAAPRARALRRQRPARELRRRPGGPALAGGPARRRRVAAARDPRGQRAARRGRTAGDGDPHARGVRPHGRAPARRRRAPGGRRRARRDDRVTNVPIGEHAVLELHGHDLEASERRLLEVIAAQIDQAIEHGALAEAAEAAGALAETDRVRSALLAAVGHDLRRPLTSASAAVSALRTPDLDLPAEQREELLDTAAESLDSLAELVTNLLDVSRVQAGALAVQLAPTDLADVVFPALDELGVGPGDVELDLADDLPPVLADAVLLQRVVVNLLANAVRHSPPGERVRLAASAFRDVVELRVVDRGAGIPRERRDEVFMPFQRLGDTDNDTGLGLGLALSKGFVEGMDGTLEVDDTPGGGLTMVVTLPAATAEEAR